MIPYVVGQWVRGERFYGRTVLLERLLAARGGATWVAGTRRIGKTSLLKELERQAAEPDRGCVALYWDLQGAVTPEELDRTFGDAVLDASERLSGLGLDPDRLAALDLAAAVERLRAALRRQGRALLLLADEAEELLTLAARHREPLGTLARLLAGDGVTTVLVASVRLAALAACGRDGAELLELVSPPRFLPPLDDDEATALIRQERLAPPVRPRLDGALVRDICRRCGNHPFLLQLLGRRALETGDLDVAVEQLQHDRVLHHLFTVDLGLLDAAERSALRGLARGGGVDEGAVGRLLGLGLLRRGPGGELDPGNDFLARWLVSSEPHLELT